jgi:hypothetical protein
MIEMNRQIGGLGKCMLRPGQGNDLTDVDPKMEYVPTMGASSGSSKLLKTQFAA